MRNAATLSFSMVLVSGGCRQSSMVGHDFWSFWCDWKLSLLYQIRNVEKIPNTCERKMANNTCAYLGWKCRRLHELGICPYDATCRSKIGQKKALCWRHKIDDVDVFVWAGVNIHVSRLFSREREMQLQSNYYLLWGNSDNRWGPQWCNATLQPVTGPREGCDRWWEADAWWGGGAEAPAKWQPTEREESMTMRGDWLEATQPTQQPTKQEGAG